MAGGNLIYSITVTNSGGTGAPGVQVTDTPGLGQMFVQADGASCMQPGAGPVTCDLGTVAAGETKPFTLTFSGSASGNCATITQPTDGNPANNGPSCVAPGATRARAAGGRSSALGRSAQTPDDCGGVVTITVRAKGRRILRRSARLRSSCRFGRSFRIRKNRIPRRVRRNLRRVTIITSFRGNGSLRSSRDVESVRVRPSGRRRGGR